ncbi:MAG: hypothetical protein E7354_04895 [Clostridiales bacterium]|nr:hypothetical protein [Clostridiales bacterium]
MKNILKNKHRYRKIVNNLDIKIHIYYPKSHNVSKGIIQAYLDMSAVYIDLDSDFQKIDVVDLDFYERWLNERY